MQPADSGGGGASGTQLRTPGHPQIQRIRPGPAGPRSEPTSPDRAEPPASPRSGFPVAAGGQSSIIAASIQAAAGQSPTSAGREPTPQRPPTVRPRPAPTGPPDVREEDGQTGPPDVRDEERRGAAATARSAARDLGRSRRRRASTLQGRGHPVGPPSTRRRGTPPPPAPRRLCPSARAGGGGRGGWGGGGSWLGREDAPVASGWRQERGLCLLLPLSTLCQLHMRACRWENTTPSVRYQSRRTHV
jgi:hypothetical protein